ncbi:hypothetical protein GCM10023149_33170 [Mucilaginibacter gynuensis]|uniref:Uncharacterized protein n=1 Tax=Mucilaginibacter gynuensis TaxID=1302236 RepID=A0ABP8GRE9_9SPHI
MERNGRKSRIGFQGAAKCIQQRLSLQPALSGSNASQGVQLQYYSDACKSLADMPDCKQQW